MTKDIRLRNLQSIYLGAGNAEELVISQYRLKVLSDNNDIINVAQQAVQAGFTNPQLKSELLQQCEEEITKLIIENEPRTLNLFSGEDLVIIEKYRHGLIDSYSDSKR